MAARLIALVLLGLGAVVAQNNTITNVVFTTDVDRGGSSSWYAGVDSQNHTISASRAPSMCSLIGYSGRQDACNFMSDHCDIDGPNVGSGDINPDEENCPCPCDENSADECATNCPAGQTLHSDVVEPLRLGRRSRALLEGNDEAEEFLTAADGVLGRAVELLPGGEDAVEETMRHLLLSVDVPHVSTDMRLELGPVDPATSTGEASVTVPHAGSSKGRTLLANPSYQSLADNCYGDKAAGCCGNQQCTVDDGDFKVAVQKSYESRAGGVYTKFTWTARAAAIGAWVDQFAALLTINAMSELSQTHDSQLELFRTTHVGCSPMDGFVAWRQTCRADYLDDTFSFYIKGQKCLTDICRPVVIPDPSGVGSLLLSPRNVSDASASCCIWVIQGGAPGTAPGSNPSQCWIGKVCESSCSVSTTPPPPPPPPSMECQRWRAEYAPFHPITKTRSIVLKKTDGLPANSNEFTFVELLNGAKIRLGPLRMGANTTNPVPQTLAYFYNEVQGNLLDPKYIPLASWTLGVLLKSRICTPPSLVGVGARWHVQASGYVTIRVGTSTYTYDAMCADDCSNPPRNVLPHQPYILKPGCVEIEILFVDAGKPVKWLHIDFRQEDGDCSGYPDYPQCNLLVQTTATYRRSLLAISEDAVDGELGLEFEEPPKRDLKWIGLGFGEGEGEGEGYGEGDGWVEGADDKDHKIFGGGTDGRGCSSLNDLKRTIWDRSYDPRNDQSTIDGAPVYLDMDVNLDLNCSLFETVLSLATNVLCPAPNSREMCKPCGQQWLAEVFQWVDVKNPLKLEVITSINTARMTDTTNSGYAVPVFATNVNNLWFPHGGTPFLANFTSQYVARFSAYLCFPRKVQVKFRICAANMFKVVISGFQVVAERVADGDGGCKVNEFWIPFNHGCRLVQIYYGQTTGQQGITVQMQLRHTYKCGKYTMQPIPPRYVLHPGFCDQCDILPPTRPPSFAPAVPPPPPVLSPITCPPDAFNKRGWLVCTWVVPTINLSLLLSRPLNGDLEGILGLDWTQADANNGANCQMLPYINFHPRCANKPFTLMLGLGLFTSYFAMRARTQLRISQDTLVRFQVYANQGFHFVLRQVTEFPAFGGVSLGFVQNVTVFSSINNRWGCQPTRSDQVLLKAGAIYTIDIKYWQGTGDKCFKVHAKVTGNCGWDYVSGMAPHYWTSNCRNVTTTTPPTSPPPVVLPDPPPNCRRWLVQIWFARELTCVKDWKIVPRIFQGVPDFETNEAFIDWPLRPLGTAISSSQGYMFFKQRFFYKAQTTVCFPANRNKEVMKIKICSAGRYVAYVNDGIYLDQDVLSNDNDQVTCYTGADIAVGQVVNGCFLFTVYFTHIQKSHSMTVQYAVANKVYSWLRGLLLPLNNYGDYMRLQDGIGNIDQANLTHPDPAIGTCVSTPACRGPCCGMCDITEAALIDVGVRLVSTKVWIHHDILRLQLKLERTNQRDGFASKWQYWRHMQVLVHNNTQYDWSTPDGQSRGSGCSPPHLQRTVNDEWCSPTTGYRGAVWDVSQVKPGKSHVITLMRSITASSTDFWGVDQICDQAALPQQAAAMAADSTILATCAVLFTFKGGSCAYGILTFRQKFQQVVPPKPQALPLCQCGGLCAGSGVCKIASTRVHNGGVFLWLGNPYPDPVKKQGLFLLLRLVDSSADTGRGVLSVTIFTNKDVTNFLAKYSKQYARPAAAKQQCHPSQPQCGISWAGSPTPTHGGTLEYSLEIPYQNTLLLRSICTRVHSSVPQDSCAVIIETELKATGVRCSVVVIIFQTSCGLSICNQSKDFYSRKLLGLSYGDIAAEYVAPDNWFPIQLGDPRDPAQVTAQIRQHAQQSLASRRLLTTDAADTISHARSLSAVEGADAASDKMGSGAHDDELGCIDCDKPSWLGSGRRLMSTADEASTEGQVIEEPYRRLNRHLVGWDDNKVDPARRPIGTRVV